MHDSCFWAGKAADFLGKEPSHLMGVLQKAHQTHCNEQANDAQLIAWQESIAILREALNGLPTDWGVIFEYILPRERGRRPDVILLPPNSIVVIEFKGYEKTHAAHIDQVAAYARDLEDYQSTCRDLKVDAILALSRVENVTFEHDVVKVCGHKDLGRALARHSDVKGPSTPTLEAFLDGDYAPLPSIVSAARFLFKKNPMPQIQRAESIKIPETLQFIREFANNAIDAGEKALILVTGVPGAGKTLVGLQFVYDPSSVSEYQAVFLSGNGPLVDVLQYTLNSTVFVQGVHGFLKQYGNQSNKQPTESVWVYDEAQRAWDDTRAQGARGPEAVSEPKDFLRLAMRRTGGAVVIGLIGEGQEIYLGEEAGLALWNEAMGENKGTWGVACPDNIAGLFGNARKITRNQKLNLTESLRTHRATDLQAWVKLLLDGQLAAAQMLARKLLVDGFPIYVTRQLASAKRHAKERYLGFEDKRFGLLASSQARNLEACGLPRSSTKMKYGPWFSDPPSSEKSCCQLTSLATEFACQGLELDFPIVAWGNDLLWNNEEKRWISLGKPQKAKDPHRLRLNSYRVLLSRGRDGMVIFVPDQKEMNDTAEALGLAGCKKFHV